MTATAKYINLKSPVVSSCWYILPKQKEQSSLTSHQGEENTSPEDGVQTEDIIQPAKGTIARGSFELERQTACIVLRLIES